MYKDSTKVVIFDLDETIGHFEEFGRFIDGLSALHEGGQFVNSYNKNAFDNISQKHFNALLDLYPEFLRPKIMKIFKSLVNLKKKDKHLKVAIYTNNMAPRSWTMYIKKYIENKIKHQLFDKVITGWRPNEKGNCRSTHQKTHSDIVKCMKLKKNTPMVFFDDQYHHKMKHRDIHYIHLHPYSRSIKFMDMIKRFMKANDNGYFDKAFIFGLNLTKEKFITIMYKILQKLGRQEITYTASKTKLTKKDIEETKRIQQSIKHFTGKKSRKKIRKTHKRKTIRILS